MTDVYVVKTDCQGITDTCSDAWSKKLILVEHKVLAMTVDVASNMEDTD